MEYKRILAAFCALVMISLPSLGRAQDRADELLQELMQAETEVAALRLENQIISEWSKSGSASMDLLLKRGRDALEVKDSAAAIEHFHALTDHAPDFAEGWHGLALAYFEAERFGPAMDALEHVLALNPNHFAALRGVGAINEQVGKPILAYRAFEKVLELRPHDPNVAQAMERLEREAIGITL
ncbi:tetratricopeptide repeat protein [Antarctobacter heliothermus]|uniref:TPR repeat-containing protein n=1 Tax=Antarctobacter heliothermus TaxID=74033 RepID=A0A239G313_9RHOB|nr:TPR repeat-containing protein [Antarctobacter heliothermus]